MLGAKIWEAALQTYENTKPCPALSANIVEFLCRVGKTQAEISKSLGVTEGFISEIAKKQKSFTIEHLLQFEKTFNEPLPLLLLKTISKTDLRPELKQLYEKTEELLRQSAQARSKKVYE
jgi:plasmid maintenance system antidote protein VapI